MLSCGNLFALLQQEMDPENPECVLDGLILQQMKEYETLGQPVNFTDEVLGALTIDMFGAGMLQQQVWNERCVDWRVYLGQGRGARLRRPHHNSICVQHKI